MTMIMMARGMGTGARGKGVGQAKGYGSAVIRHGSRERERVGESTVV